MIFLMPQGITAYNILYNILSEILENFFLADFVMQ